MEVFLFKNLIFIRDKLTRKVPFDIITMVWDKLASYPEVKTIDLDGQKCAVSDIQQKVQQLIYVCSHDQGFECPKTTGDQHVFIRIGFDSLNLWNKYFIDKKTQKIVHLKLYRVLYIVYCILYMKYSVLSCTTSIGNMLYNIFYIKHGQKIKWSIQNPNCWALVL